MEVTLGFVAVLILIIFPGLIFRRLYFYGEFSKQFNSKLNFVSLIAVSSIPGIINLVLIFYFYDYFITDIDLGEIIDKFKDVNNPNFRYTKSNDIPIKKILNEKASPFLGFLYLAVTIFGALLGRFIRISRLDTKFKLLRFKNYWFYLFNGQMSDFKKMKHLKKENRNHLFTKADILIETNSEILLYSGIVVDYELQADDSKTLSKVMLQNAERYSIENNKRISKTIPGTLLVVDCSTMKNINLTYIYEKPISLLKSKIPNTIQLVYGIIIILLIPFFIFKAESININLYNTYFSLSWFSKFFAYLFIVQFFGLFNPFIEKKGEYIFVTFKDFFLKILLLAFFLFLIWVLN